MKSSAKLVIAAGLTAASIIAVAGLTRWSRGDADPSSPVVKQPTSVEASREAVQPERPAQPEESEHRQEAHRPTRRYQAVAERNVFRPLLTPPRETKEGEELRELVPGAAEQPGVRDARAQSAGPRQAPDPLADLALTGITQVGDRLRALLERVSTRTGRYVSVGEEFHGFRILEIQADSVVLEKDGQQGTLSMGAKRLSSETQQRPERAATKKVEDSQTPTSLPAPPSRRAMDVREGFGEEMLSWAESMSLPELERMYAQYGDYLSPQQRAQAETYLQERRARGR